MRNNVVELRNKQNLTRAELAKKLGIAEITVRKIEEGSRNPSINMAKKFAIYFESELDYLFPDIFLLEIDTKGIK